jgi:hypothetical protein
VAFHTADVGIEKVRNHAGHRMVPRKPTECDVDPASEGQKSRMGLQT